MSALRWLVVGGFTVVLTSLLISTPAESAEREQFDTTYIGSDTAIVVVAHPQRVLARDSKVPVNAKQMLEMFKQQSGIDAGNLRQLVLQFGTETRGEDGRAFAGNEAVTGVFRFDKPIDADEIAATGFKRNTKAIYKGQTYYQSASKYQPAAWFPDDHTMIMGNEWRVLKLIDEPNSMGLMVSRMRQADGSADLLIEVDVQRAAPLLREAFRHLPEEEPFAPLKTIEKLTRVTVTAKLATDTPLEAQLLTKNAETAKELQAKGVALLTMAQAAWSKQRDDVRQRARDEEKQMVDAMIETIDTILAGTKLTTEGNRLTVQVEKNGGSVDLLTLFMGTFMVSRAVAVDEAEALRIETVKEAEAAREKANEAAQRALEERKRAEKQKRQDR